MRDKDLQRELWRKSKEFDNLEKVLGAIRASEGAAHHQSAEAGQAVWQPSRPNVKCFNCDKLGHTSKNYKEGAKNSNSNLKSHSKCGFCDGPKSCKARECKAFKMKCAGCNKFGHFKKCCNANTRAKARDTEESGIKAVEEDINSDTQSLSFVTTATKKEEKKERQRERKANTKKVEVEVDEVKAQGKEEVITINHISHLPPQHAQSIVWCPRANRFVQKI